MRKILSLITAICCLVSLAGCVNTGTGTVNTDPLTPTETTAPLEELD